MSPARAQALKEAGIQRVHHNVETAESYYDEVSTTVRYEGRIRTIQAVREAGLETCVGGILNLGESREQRVEMAFELAALDPTSVPINLLNPRPGTKFGDREPIDPWEAVKWIAIFRLILPEALFRLCGGRVENLGELQPLAVKAGLNGVMMGNFLTTLGSEPEEDRAMFEQLGLNVARQPDNGANPRPDNRAGWLDGETPDVVDELLGESTPVGADKNAANGANTATRANGDTRGGQGESQGLAVRLWDPSTQLRFKAKRTVPPRPDGARTEHPCALAPTIDQMRTSQSPAPAPAPSPPAQRAGETDRATAEALAMNEIEQRLEELERLGLSRRMRMVSGPQGPRVLLDGKSVLLLCSNNYLGLADHPRVREAAAEAAMRWGVGTGASRLVSGTMTIHRRLEQRLAAFERSEACVLFGSGYLANAGAIGALAGRGDTVFSDELNHASIVDGCRCSRADVVVYRHRDMGHLDWLARRDRGNGRRLIVTDSVFSMDGDVAPLTEIVELARVHGARTIVDEAHATGVLGPGGRGAVAEAGLEGEIDIVVGTLGKALGSYGAYACARGETIRYLINTARPLIFSTAPPPPAIAGALAALELLEERPHRVRRLRSNARALRHALASEGVPTEDTEMHIVPLIVGDERAAMSLCEAALQRGVFAQAIRPPTVAQAPHGCGWR